MLACGLVCGALVTLGGCAALTAGLLGGTDASAHGTVEAQGHTSPAVLVTGECLDAVSGSLSAGITVVPCSDDHDWEVYLQAGVDGAAADAGAFPGADAVVAVAEEACAAQFLPFLGVPTGSGGMSNANTAATAAYGYTYLAPLERDWSASAEQVVSCLIGDMNGPVSGSLAGAGAAAPDEG